MRDFLSLSGPWMGWSIQDGIRITERMRLSITPTMITGEGSDMDGEFELTGSYDARSNALFLTRRYTVTAHPSQAGVGIPYMYVGTWDGSIASGRWSPRADPAYGGPFEMWPAGEEDLKALAIEISDVAVHA